MKSATHLVTALAVSGLCACSGCALVPFPVSRTLPNPIRQVEVVQQGTYQPIANAEVVIHAERFKNWIRSFPPQLVGDFTPPAETGVVIPVQQAAPGRFTPERRRVWRYVRPWGIGPLGTTIHEDYALSVSARAEGYMPLTVTYSPAGSMNPAPEVIRADVPVCFPHFGTNGTLTVFLCRKDAERDGASNLNQPIRSK